MKVILSQEEKNSNIINLSKEEAKFLEDDKYKLTTETQQKLLAIYKKQWNAGLIAEKQTLKNYTCLPIDLSCYALKYSFGRSASTSLNSLEYKINATHYDVEHIDQFKKWIKNPKDSKGNAIPSPGHYFAIKQN